MADPVALARALRAAPPVQGGISVPTQQMMANNPDLDRGLYQAPVNPAMPQPLGNDPTQRVSQSQYDIMLAKQRADQAAAYQAYKQRR